MANETVVRVTADASGYTTELDRARRSAAAFAESSEAASRRVQTAQAAIRESVANGASASTRQVNAFINSLARQAETAGKSRVELLRMQATQFGVSQAAEAYIRKIEESTAAIQRAGEAVHTFSLKSAGARRELLVLGHEALTGSWSNFGGSLLVLGERTDALSKLMSPLGIAIGAAGAAAYAFFHIIHEGQQQYDAFQRAIKSTHGAMGVTAEAMVSMSNGLQTTKTSLSSVRETMAALANTGAVTGDQLRATTQAAVGMAEDTGMSAEDAVKSLAKIRDNVIGWMTEYQSAHHVFTAAQVEEVQKLVDTGDTAGATAAIIRDLNKAHDEAAKYAVEKTGVIVRAWRLLAADVQDTINHIMALGVPEGNLEKMVRQTAELNAANARYQNAIKPGSLSGVGVNLASLKADVEYRKQQLDLTRKSFAEDQKATKALAASATAGDARLRVNAYIGDKKYATPAERHKLDLDEEAKQFAAATKNIDTQSAKYQEALRRHQSNVKQIDESYSKSQHHGAGNEFGVGQDLADLQGQLKAREDALKSSLDHIKALQQQGVIDSSAALRQEHDARAAALADELKIVNQESDVAGRRKNLTEMHRYQAEAAKIQQQISDNDRKYSDDRATLQAKDQRAVEEYTAALLESIKNRESAIRTQLQNLGLSDRAADELQRIEALYKDFDKDMLSLQKQRASNSIDQSVYDQEVAARRDALQKQVQLEKDATSEIKAAQQDGWLGAGKALADYVDTANNRYSQIEQSVTDTFKSMEDVIVQFATTGKVSFSSFVNSVIADLIRMQVRSAAAGLLSSAGGGIASLIGKLTGGVSTGAAVSIANTTGGDDVLGSFLSARGFGQRATGGPVGYGQSYLVGENGPELFTPSTGGAITNNAALVDAWRRQASSTGATAAAQAATVAPGSQAPVINITNASSAEVTDISATRAPNGQWALDMAIKAMRRDLIHDARSGGPVTKAFGDAHGIRRVPGNA